MTIHPETSAPICVCGLQMVERRNKATGEPFYGCKKFPHCRHTEPVESDEENDQGPKGYPISFEDVYD